MNPRIFNTINRRLSLRQPQRESFQQLAQALDSAPAMQEAYDFLQLPGRADRPGAYDSTDSSPSLSGGRRAWVSCGHVLAQLLQPDRRLGVAGRAPVAAR